MATSDGFPAAIVVSFCCFYFVVFIVSTLGNTIVLTVCYRSLKRQTSSLKVMIANLATADLAFTFLSILDLITFLWTWIGGQTTCKLQGFLIEACYTTSITTLVLISYERLRVVLQPFSAVTNSPNRAFAKVFAIWVLSFLVCSPLLYAYQTQPTDNGSVHCTNLTFGDSGRQIYYGLHAVSFFLVPLFYMLYAQSTIFRSLRLGVFPTQNAFTTSSTVRHRKVARTLAALTAAFFVCWCPFVIVRALMYFNLTDGGYVWRGAQLLIFLNSALDPILYGLYGENLGSVLRGLLRRHFRQETTSVKAFVTNRTTEKMDGRRQFNGQSSSDNVAAV